MQGIATLFSFEVILESLPEDFTICPCPLVPLSVARERDYPGLGKVSQPQHDL